MVRFFEMNLLDCDGIEGELEYLEKYCNQYMKSGRKQGADIEKVVAKLIEYHENDKISFAFQGYKKDS